jgi:uncharacterized protein YxeA
LMKKKVTVIVVILIVIILIGAGVMWRMRRTEAEGSSLGDNQKYVYAYVSSIEGNEITYMEVDESVAKAAEENADSDSMEQAGNRQAPADMSGTSTEQDSSDQAGQVPPDMDSTKMPSDAPGGMSDMTGETVTTLIPVGVTVHTASDTETTFSRLAAGDPLKILVETDISGNDVIEEIWMLQ